MPTLREPTAAELAEFERQGYDTSKFPKQLLFNDGVAAGGDKYSALGSVGKSLQAHAGGIAGGGLLSLAASAMLPTGVGTIPALAIMAGSGLVGSLVGESGQKDIQGEESFKRLQEEAAQAEAEHPWLTTSANITANALASGGSFKPSNIPRALTALRGGKALAAGDQAVLEEYGRRALSEQAESILRNNELNREALHNLAIQTTLNPAINAGIEYAATGHTPTIGSLLTSAAGGALFSGQSRLGKAFSPAHVNEIDWVGEQEKYRKEQIGELPKDGTETPVQKTTAWLQKNEDGTHVIDDGTVKTAYQKAFPKPEPTGGQDTEGYVALAKYKQDLAQPESMRQKLNDYTLQQEATQAKEAETLKAKKTEEAQAAENEAFRNQQIDENVKRAQAQRDAQQTEEQARQQTEQNALMQEKMRKMQTEVEEENRKQQLEDLEGQRQKEIERLKVEEENQKKLAEEKAKQEALDQAGKEAFERSLVKPNGEVDPVKAELEMRGSEVHYAPHKEGEVLGDNWLLEHGTRSTIGAHLETLKGDREVGEIAKALNIDKESLNVPVINHGDEFGFPYWAKHDNGVEAIHIFNDSSPRQILHEIVHGATIQKIKALGENHPLVKELQDCYNEFRRKLGYEKEQAASEELKVFKGYNDVDYAASNFREFLAQIFSAPRVQEALSKIPSKGGGNLWSRLVQVFRNMLGIKTQNSSLLERVLKPTEELIKMERPGQKREPTPGSVQSKVKYGNEQDKIRSLDAVLNGTKKATFIHPDEHHLATEAHRKGLQIIPGEGVTEGMGDIVVKKGPDGIRHAEELVNILRDGSYEDRGKFFGYTDKEIEGFSRRVDDIQRLEKEGKSEDEAVVEVDRDNEKYYAPPNWSQGQPKEKATGGKLGEFFERTIDKIARIEHPLARPFAQAAQRMLNERQNLVGEWLHPILREAKDLSNAQLNNLEKAARWMIENKADPRYMLRTTEEKRVFSEVLKSLEKNFNYRFTNKEPVIRGGRPTMPQRDQFYFPTTPNPKVIEAYKNNDQAAMGKFDKLFTDYQTKLGASPSEAAENLKNFREAIQGNVWTSAGVGQTQNFGAARKAQGLPLPPEMTRPGFLKNIEAYFHRMATDNSYYKNIESNDSLMQSLGSTANPWGKKLVPDSNSIAGAEPVQAFLKNIRTESGSSGYHAERSLSSLATAMFLGPRTEMHKIISNFVGVANHLDNPYQTTRFLAGAIRDRAEGLVHAEKNGVLRIQSGKLSDVWSRDLTMADRLRSLGQSVRKVYTLNGLTDELGTSLMQAGFENVLPDKLAKANAGDVRNRELFERLDPDYIPGKSYTPEEMTKLASNMINHIQGTGDARTMPPWMLRDSELQGFFRLAHWSIAQTNNFFSDVYKPATRGEYQPLVKAVFGAAIGGTIIKELAELIKGKKDQIPSLSEIAATKEGIAGHPKALMYNMMAAATYAGFGGMLSGLIKAPIDWLNSNQSQGMSFPLDEYTTEMAEIAKNVAGAIAKDPNLNWGRLAQEVSIKLLNSNFQTGRVIWNQAINNGIVTGTPAERKMLADKLGDLRRFNMIEGNPINDEAGAGNPFMNLEQKSFKLETDPQKAIAQIPGMISNIMEKWYDKPDIMRQKLEALKQNQYSTFPSFEKLPLQFIEYLGYVTRLKGDAAAQEELQNYMQHHMINRMKSAVIP